MHSSRNDNNICKWRQQDQVHKIMPSCSLEWTLIINNFQAYNGDFYPKPRISCQQSILKFHHASKLIKLFTIFSKGHFKNQ